MTTSPPNDQVQGSARTAVSRLMFGKRLQPLEREVSYRRERLRIIGSEINFLTAYRIEANAAFAHLCEEGEPVLVLGKAIGLTLSVEIEPNTGFLVLYEENGRNDCVLITASEERLIDQIVSLASAVAGDLTPRVADAAVDVLVGRSIDEVVRRLILRTLLHANGDRKQAAFALGVDETFVRLKLRQYFGAKANAPAFSEGEQ